jgi:hypothetical protein
MQSNRMKVIIDHNDDGSALRGHMTSAAEEIFPHITRSGPALNLIKVPTSSSLYGMCILHARRTICLGHVAAIP